MAVSYQDGSANMTSMQKDSENSESAKETETETSDETHSKDDSEKGEYVTANEGDGARKEKTTGTKVDIGKEKKKHKTKGQRAAVNYPWCPFSLSLHMLMSIIR